MVTVKELAFNLIYKKEHYPLSDEFMANYRQEKGGYSDFAAKTGHPIEPSRCEPNQKWHFFESLLIRSFEDGTINSWDDDAKKVYNKSMQCPELMLWFLEAIGIDFPSVEAAKKIAEKGKKTECRPNSIAKEIRKFIPWEAIENTIKQ